LRKNKTRIKYDDSGLIFNKEKFEEPIKVIDISLKEHKLPIMVGVQHPYWNKDDSNWYYKCGYKIIPLVLRIILLLLLEKDMISKKNGFLLFLRSSDL
jgi:hypothetical protein